MGLESNINEDDFLLSQGNSRPHRSRFRPKWLLSASALASRTLLVLLAIWGAVSILMTAKTWIQAHGSLKVSRDPSPCFCGYSIVEAKSLGCKYDSLSAAWLPPHCRDDELTADFEVQGPGPNGSWIYWADREHTQELSLYEVSLYAERQPELFHTSLEWHRKHCIWSWLKEHRAKFNGVTYDPRSDTEAHIRHCGMMLTEESNGTTSGVVLIS